MSNKFKVKKGLIVNGDGGTVVDIQGNSGQLFSVTDSLIGVLMSINDISGIPIFQVSSDDTVTMGPYGNPFIINAIGLSIGANLVVDSNGNVKFDGTPTTTNQNRGIYWTAYDKEGTTDPSDAAYIRHTTNSGGLAGSVLEISSQNDADDGVNFLVNSTASGVRINGNAVLNASNFNSYSPTLTGTGASGTWSISITGNAATATTAGALTSMNISQFTNNSGYIASSGTTNYVPKFTSASAIGDSQIFDNGTNVGIGTTSPGEKLDILGSGAQFLKIANVGTYLMRFGIDASNNGYIGSSNATPIGFHTNGGNRLFITTDGNVGIGTTSPLYKLQVIGDISFPSRNTAGTYRIGMGREDANGWSFTQNIGFNSDSSGGYITFETQKPGVGGGEYMRLTADGNLLIGTTTDSGYKLDVSGTGRFTGAVTVGSRLALQPSYFGYSSSYKTLLIGSAGTDYTTNAVSLAFNVDITGNPSGAFNGSGQEYIWRNAGVFITPNAANTTYNTLFSWNSSGQLTFNQATTLSSSLTVERIQINSSTYEPLSINSSYGQVGLKFGLNGTYFAAIGSATNVTGAYAGSGTDLGLGTSGSATANITFATGASYLRRMTITADGNVGIGTTSPDTPLFVQGGPAGTGGWNRTATLSATYPGLIFNSNGTKWGGMAYDFSAAMRFWVNANNNDIFAGTLALSILNNGNVGIGTTSPDTKLHVVSSEASVLRLISSGGDARINIGHSANGGFIGYSNTGSTGNLFYVTTGAGTIGSGFVMDNNGNVGIGTTTPGSKIDVISSTTQIADFRSTVTDGLSNIRIVNDQQTTASGTSPAAIELVGKRGNSTHGRHAWIGAEGVDGTTFRTQIKFKIRAEDSAYEWSTLPTQMVIDGNGNVGIGTTSPTTKIDVRGNFLLKGDATDGGILTITRRYSTGAQTINFNNNHPTTNLDWTGARITSADAGSYNGYLDFAVSLGNNGSEAAGTAAVASVMRLTKDGNVGIGTTAPGYKLDVNGNIGATGVISETFWTNDSIRKLNSGASINFRNSAGTIEMILNGSGNVGIGTTSPDTRLHIVGDSVQSQGLLKIQNDHSAGGEYFPAASFINTRGTHSYGIVAEFKTNTAGDADRPSILFYGQQVAGSWQVGQVSPQWGTGDSFGIGYRASNTPSTFGAWPTLYFNITTAGAAIFSSSVTASSFVGPLTGNASTATLASTVTINYNDDTNSSYQMLWGSGNSVYGTAGVYLNPSSDTIYAAAYRGNANVAGTGEAIYAPAGVYSTGTNWLYGTMYLNGNTINEVSQLAMNGTNTAPINITGASHKYITINPGNGYEAMVRYVGGSGSSWYVGKRTESQVVGTESFHFYSEATAQTVAGISTTGDMIAIGSMQSPIYYDLNNTNYFLNPASTSNLGIVKLNSTASGTEVFTIDGVNGRLFTVTDDMTDSIFSVNTISGLPVIEAFADYKVVMGRYNQNDFIINASGQVSIGTAAQAAYKFTVFGGQYGSYFRGGDLGTGSDIARFVDSAGTTRFLVRGDGAVLKDGNTVWHAGNHGSGSGLDADLLDGQHGSYYAAASSLGSYLPLAGGTMTGTITITSTDIRSDASSGWTGDPGAQGKIQYHANRWYIVADSSSDRIVQFRRNATDVSHIDNSGNYIGNASTATTAGSITSQANSATITATTAATADRIVLRDGSGDIFSRYSFSSYVNTSDNDESGITRFVIKNGDDYHRSATTTVAADIIRGVASGSWGISISGNAATATSATEVASTVAGGSEANLLSATIGDNDFFRLRVGGGSNAGFAEIATADDGTEPIHVRQYTGVFTSLTRTATLLDGSGNTSFPGTVTAPTFSGALSGNATTATTAGALTSMNISQFTNNSGYITSYTETDTLASVTARGSTTTTSITAERYIGNNSLVLNTFATVNPSSNVFLYSQPNDRDSWIYLDSADTGSNWGIYHRQIDSAVSGLEGNSIGFIGGGANGLRAYIGLSTGNGYFAGTISASNFSGTSSGTNTGDQTNISGNAATATSAINLIGLGVIQSTSVGTSYQNNYEVRENSGGGGNTNEIYAPQLAFHWSGVVASSIMMEASGRIAIRNNPGGSYENFAANAIYANNGITSAGSILPSSNNAYDLGSSSLGWRNIYTNDLHLSNMNKPEGNDIDGTSGTWTIQEGAENLYIINNLNGKKYRITLEEI
jgi:hypothetical protein